MNREAAFELGQTMRSVGLINCKVVLLRLKKKVDTDTTLKKKAPIFHFNKGGDWKGYRGKKIGGRMVWGNRCS